jgi:hypothetical protein
MDEFSAVSVDELHQIEGGFFLDKLLHPCPPTNPIPTISVLSGKYKL